MAEIDIKDLGDAAAIADTDKIMAIINGLGKNLNWAKLKEQLVKELPAATNDSNGLLSSNLFGILSRLRIIASNGGGAGISGWRGMSLIMAYQKSNMNNFCIYMTIKKQEQTPSVYTLKSNVLSTGANNHGGTIVINGAGEDDIVQISFCVDSDNII